MPSHRRLDVRPLASRHGADGCLVNLFRGTILFSASRAGVVAFWKMTSLSGSGPEHVKHDPRNDVATKHNMMHACPSSLEEMSAELHLWEETLALILHFEKNRRVNY